MNQNNRLLLIYKSVERLGGMMHLGIAGADEPTGPYRRLRDEPIFVADKLGDHVEDPFFWHDRGTYHVIMKAMKGRLGGEPRGGISIETADVLHWPRPEVAVERAYSRHVRWDDGSMTTQSFLERPHLLIEEGKPTHLFAATAIGSDAIGHVTDSWNMVIPLRS
ncbi:MAG: hypothetical protein HC898_12125 [Phycisphaerales bacterium]|nr:hypothetical protein [Phycisphaerales bacterium]